ncbi:unnamed protein product [Urochloa decumbens]|uniref:Uncharacterized protein n=1 Tax=Urochloa decumbens TaxID=240449 RepID=A0ABC9B4N9_9POAL
MAEAVVGVLIGKLAAALTNEAAAYGASLLCKEASSLKGLFREIRTAEAELESMNAYLRDSEKFKDTDETTGIFVNKIRELSFRIEDVVDEFMYKLEDKKHGGFVAKTTKRIKHVKVWRRLALQLREINAELEDTTKRRARYVIPGMQGHTGTGSNGNHQATSTNQTLCSAREEDLVGIEENAEKLKGWLVKDLEERNTKVTTVWGMGGVGKTTLADHVYKIVKVHFDAAACVTVSKSYQVEDLLKKIAIEFGTSIGSSNMDTRRLVDVIRNHLEEGYILKRRRLIRHWITAGFIKEKENKTLEGVAEGFLNELVNRSLLQAVQKNGIGRVKCCRMHDVIRHIAVDKAEKESFGKVYDGHGTVLLHATRRLSIQSTNAAPLNQSGGTHLRAIHAFTSSIDIDLLRPILASSLSLSILDLQGQLEKTHMPQMFSSWSHLKNLNILSLRSSTLNEDSFSSLATLRSLCFLGLYRGAYNGKIMCFSAQSFPRLRRLEICEASQLNQLKIEKGALESLVELLFSRCRELKHLPHGIEYITNLEVLYLLDTAEELIEKLRKKTDSYKCNEEHMKIRHIRKVVVRLTEKNIWERIR